MKDPRDQLWKHLTAQASAVAPAGPVEPTSEFVDRVIRHRNERPLLNVASTWDSPLAAGVAWFALAASLAIAVWQWPLIEAAWWPQFEPWQLVVLVEP